MLALNKLLELGVTNSEDTNVNKTRATNKITPMIAKIRFPLFMRFKPFL